MTTIASDAILAAFVLFCRIGACLMLMPGFSSRRVPRSVRLFLAIAITLALAPLLRQEIDVSLLSAEPVDLLWLVASELCVGALIGLLGRIFFAALETLASFIAFAIGLSSPLGGPADDHEVQPSITSLVMLAATVLFFVAELHWEVLRGLVASYVAMPVAKNFDAHFGLLEVSDGLVASFALSLRIASPFVVYALIVNLAVGVAAKFTPQIPVYFMTVPAVLCGGLFLLYVTSKPLLEMFTTAFAAWLVTGGP